MRSNLIGLTPLACKPITVLVSLELMKLATVLREEVVSLTAFLARPSKYLKGVVRVVDKKARSVGLFLDAEALDELLEDIEASSPAFLASLERSRRSGRVSAKAIERRLGL
jgi:hypothetical protein